jgi:hypothetical protein
VLATVLRLFRRLQEILRTMDNKICLLKISGTIGSPKHKEFEQTIRFVFNLLPSTCLASHLARDVFRTDAYHLFTLWPTATDLSIFKESSEYDLIRGAFDALGFMDRSFAGHLSDVQTFESDDV